VKGAAQRGEGSVEETVGVDGARLVLILFFHTHDDAGMANSVLWRDEVDYPLGSPLDVD